MLCRDCEAYIDTGDICLHCGLNSTNHRVLENNKTDTPQKSQNINKTPEHVLVLCDECALEIGLPEDYEEVLDNVSPHVGLDKCQLCDTLEYGMIWLKVRLWQPQSDENWIAKALI